MATTTGYLSFGKKNLPSPSIETEISFAIVFLVVKSDARKFRCLKNGPLQRLFSGKHSLALIPLSLNKFVSITEQSVFKFAYDDATVTVFFSSKSVGRSSVTSSCFSRLVVNYLSFRQKYDDCENLEILFFPDNFFLQFLDKILKNDERWKKLQLRKKSFLKSFCTKLTFTLEESIVSRAVKIFEAVDIIFALGTHLSGKESYCRFCALSILVS